jgi:ABC-type uncharacterized transport system fused permease/ATPase subunit
MGAHALCSSTRYIVSLALFMGVLWWLVASLLQGFSWGTALAGVLFTVLYLGAGFLFRWIRSRKGREVS